MTETAISRGIIRMPLDSPLESAVPGGNVVVLLVEDNRADVLIIEKAIALYGLPVKLYVAQDGAEAFDFIGRAESVAGAPRPEIVLLDLNLPKRSGKEVLERLRESPACRNARVLVVSSSNSPKERRGIEQLGVDDYFCKPASLDGFLEIGARLQALLGRREA